MENTLVSYIKVRHELTQEEVLVAVDTDNVGLAEEQLRRYQDAYSNPLVEYTNLSEFISSALEDIPHGIAEFSEVILK